MHKRFVNHCTIDLSISPDGPILIKSGKEGADPTKPDMEFVEAYYQGGRSIFLPGSSLKGAIRAHSERIVRTVGKDKPPQNNSNEIWANDPLNDKYEYLNNKKASDIYKLSSFTDQMFGNTSIASRVRIEDAYPVPGKPVKLEERNGVAIDRVFGSVAVGPFNYQVCTEAEFRTKIHLKNFTLAQLALIGLVLRDLDEGWFGLGFAKSRGLGTVKVTLNSATVSYPGCILKDREVCLLGSEKKWTVNKLLGAGMFLDDNPYDFPRDDEAIVPVSAESMDLGFGVKLTWNGEEQVKDIFIKAMSSWRNLLAA
ncbi:RAMP superfamily CRISPR-associated protein [Baaleninema sp.]|uniref:RAMP superfamily CRISPR-associated protein n=1 Tax=Baaleninema sp. TaxID=3101197 RepID=UPI003D04E425